MSGGVSGVGAVRPVVGTRAITVMQSARGIPGSIMHKEYQALCAGRPAREPVEHFTVTAVFNHLRKAALESEPVRSAFLVHAAWLAVPDVPKEQGRAAIAQTVARVASTLGAVNSKAPGWQQLQASIEAECAQKYPN